MTEQWYADGLLLTEGAVRQWEYRSGTGRAGGLVGGNTTVPNRDGETWRRKQLPPGQFVFNMWVAGVDAAGAEAEYEKVLQHTARSERLVQWSRYKPDGTVRYCMGEVISSIEPTYIGQTAYRFGLEVRVPSGKWTLTSQYALAATPGAGLPKRLSMPQFSKATAPMSDLLYTVYGPINAGFTIADLNGPDSLTYSKALAVGEKVTFNAATWQVLGYGGHVVNLAAVNPNGPRLMTLSPGNSLITPTLELRGSGGAATTNLQIDGAPQFLC